MEPKKQQKKKKKILQLHISSFFGKERIVGYGIQVYIAGKLLTLIVFVMEW